MLDKGCPNVSGYHCFNCLRAQISKRKMSCLMIKFEIWCLILLSCCRDFKKGCNQFGSSGASDKEARLFLNVTRVMRGPEVDRLGFLLGYLDYHDHVIMVLEQCLGKEKRSVMWRPRVFKLYDLAVRRATLKSELEKRGLGLTICSRLCR